MIVPCYRKLTLYEINREFPKLALILVALIYVNVNFHDLNFHYFEPNFSIPSDILDT